MKMKDAQIRVKAGPDDGLEEGQFEAYASVFGNKDSYGDVVVKGAFADTLETWMKGDAVLPVLFGHNMQDPDFNIGAVLEAKEDEHGLWVKAQLDLDSPKGLQTYRLIKGRRISQMSFAYDVLEGGWATRQKDADGGDGDDNQEEYYELRKLKLYEVSVVPIGANQETEILAAKALQEAERKMLATGGLDAKSYQSLLGAYHALGDLLMGSKNSDTANAASDEGQTNEEAREGNSEESRQESSASKAKLAAQIKILSLKGE